MNNKVIIIGAGPAGLAAAITLAEKILLSLLSMNIYMLAGDYLDNYMKRSQEHGGMVLWNLNVY